MDASCLRVFTLLTLFAFINFFTVQAQNQPPDWDESSVDALKRGISEATAVGTSLAQLRCIDPDNDKILYKKTKGTSVTVEFSGLVKLAVALDFEDRDTIGYDLAFACYDVDGNGIPIHNDVEYELELTVDDANDIAPEFKVSSNEGYTFSVSEAAQPGIQLKPTIEILDGDRGRNAELSNLYLICDSPNPADLVDLPETSVATCKKFGLTRRQLGSGIHEATLVLKGTLDFEGRPVYSSKIVAIDNAIKVSTRLSTTINIQIQILDAQDVGPLFVNLGASAVVSEGAKKGDPVNMVIQARDGDFGDKRPVKLVMEEDRNNAFTLGQSSPAIFADAGVYEARLIVENALDRESLVGAYDFVVKVIELDKTTGAETDATATATYSVQVSDIDDEPPQFESPIYSVNVTEMVATNQAVQIAGLRMVCNDKDEPQNARYNVRIVDQTFPGAFSISPSVSFTGTAILFLTVDNAKFLDYDTVAYRKQSVVLEALSTGPNKLSSSTTVSITLIDINDNKPKFTKQNYEFKVSEAVSKLPHVIDTIEATDDDSGENGRITFSLEGGNANKFDINPRTGVLELVSRVDFEKTPLYVFLVYAADNGQDGQTSQVQVTVEVENYNDLYPEFEQPFYLTSVNEDQLTFLTPINIKAFDTEEGTGQITYKIIEGQTADNAFNLDPTSGSLTLKRNLNYGEKDKGIYKLRVEASDNGRPNVLKSYTNVTINVIDQNNFKPVIDPKFYTNEVSELVKPDTLVATILGSDRDKGEFGKITYRISSGAFDNFVIDPNTGRVTVNDPHNLDFDQRKLYTIKIIGSDGGAPQLFDEATLTVDIKDANNKPPEFLETIYIATVDEEKPVNFVITTVEAKDIDGNSDLHYSIQENSISARNGAGNLLTSTNRYNYKELLAVNEKTGDVYIKNKLDKEQALEFNFIVQVEDKNSQTGKQIDTTRVAITVTGEANTDLTFDPVETIFVNEGSPKGYELTTVTARDPTTQQGIRNYQQIENISPFFEIVKTTGQIRIKKEIDYEEDAHTHRIVIQALANDNIRSVSTTVTIKINDDNDNVPQFDRSEYVTQVDEDAPSLTRVANIFATDRDTPSFGPIEYSIAGGLDSDHFELYKASRGVDVLVARGVSLDYNTRDYYELDIIATDNPGRQFSKIQQFSSVKLKITVVDKNNHKPEFKDAGVLRKIPVAETAGIGRSVATVIALDNDFGVNGEVSYDLRAIADDRNSLTALQLFDIVPGAGIITVAQSLVGYGGKVYRLQVFAQDGGEPFLSNTLEVEIEVLSTENNDGNPIWFRPDNNHIFFAPEEKPGHVVKENNQPFIFSAGPQTGNDVIYRLSNLSSNVKSFKVDNVTGVLTIVDSLDREVQESYNLLVYAEDISDPLKIRTGRQIIIRLTDEDDNSPVFTNPKNYPICGEPIDRPLEINFDEEVKKDQVIYQVSACDPDASQNIEYYPYDTNPECKENNAKSGLRVEKDGKVITKKHIDYEEDQTYIMCIYATDPTALKRRKRAIDTSQLPDNVAYIIFHIKDLNDNGPVFPDAERSAVMETDARDLPIIVLDAVDKDGKGFNIPVYSIIDTKFYASGSNTPSYPGKAFVMKNNELHPDPPRGHTYQDFAKGRFVLTIQAEDPVNARYTDTQIVTVYVHIKGQVMKVILSMTPDKGIAYGESIVSELNGVNQHYAFSYLHVSVHESKDGIDRDKTDVCFIAVDRNSHMILSTFQLISVLAKSEYNVVLEKDEYEIQDIGKCHPSTSSEEQMKWKDLWWVLVVLAIFVGFCAICFIVIIFFMYRKYRRYMETEKTYLVPQ